MKIRVSPLFVVLGSAAAIGLLAPWRLPDATAVPSPPDSVVLAGTVRDFRRGHADFDVTLTEVADHVAGNVLTTLGGEGRPVAATKVGTSVTPTIDTVAGWGFDEGIGLIAGDATGVHDGGLTNGPAWVAAGKVDGALRFDGVDDFVEVPHHADFMLDEVTVAFWVNAEDPVPQQGVISKDSTTYDNGGHFTVFVQDSRVRIRLQSTSASYWVESAAGSVQPDTWYHVAFSFGPAGMQLYLDGALVDTDPYTGGLGTTSGGTGNEEPWAFGVNTWLSDDESTVGWIEPFRGMIDELQMYDIELTPISFTAVAGDKITSSWRDADGRPIAPHLSTAPWPAAPCLTVADTAGTTLGDSDGGISSAASFDAWFRDVLGTNLSASRSIVLTRTGTVYEYLDDAFYPIDGSLLGNEGDIHNNFFTYGLTATFDYDECTDQFIEFEGGNGVWMFLDDRLVMDLGGVLPSVGQFVEIDRLGLTDGARYTVRLFYAHRDDSEAVFRLRTNLVLDGPSVVLVSGGFD